MQEKIQKNCQRSFYYSWIDFIFDLIFFIHVVFDYLHIFFLVDVVFFKLGVFGTLHKQWSRWYAHENVDSFGISIGWNIRSSKFVAIQSG